MELSRIDDAIALDSSGEFVVLVPLSNPETEAHLISLGAAIANRRNGRVVAATVVQVPERVPLEDAQTCDRFRPETADLHAQALRGASDLGVPVETETIFTHRLFGDIIDAAHTHEADLCIVGWGPSMPAENGRIEPVVTEIGRQLPCDFLLFRNRNFGPQRILLPTRGGPHANLAATIARILQMEYGSAVTLLHVANNAETGQEFLNAWAQQQAIKDYEIRVETGDVERAIVEAATTHTMLLIGATQAGIFPRIAQRSPVFDVMEQVDCSVLLTEYKTERDLFSRLFTVR